MVPQKRGFTEKQENAQNCQKLPCNRQWTDLGICDGITNSCLVDEKIVPWCSHDGWVSIYVTEYNINDDGFFKKSGFFYVICCLK